MHDDDAPPRKRALIRSHRDLEVYERAMEAAMRIFEHSKSFPREETYSLTDQVRRSSRSVCANFAEPWRKRRYKAAFISKLSEVEAETTESQVWIEFAAKCGYLPLKESRALYVEYENILRTVVGMINHPDKWVL